MNLITKNIIVLNEVVSTNNYANQLILSKEAEEGTVVLAHYQQKGKGQQGNSWESEYGKNLLASFILYPQFLPANKQFYLAKIVSLALIDFLAVEDLHAEIKWPNDIYIGNKKIAGILIENAIHGNNLYSTVAGVGLNLNQEKFLSDAPNPVSLKQITGKDYVAETVAIKLQQHIGKWYSKLASKCYSEIDEAYFGRLFRLNEWAKFSKQGIIFEARIAGIGEFGQLILQECSGKISEYLFKEVEFL